MRNKLILSTIFAAILFISLLAHASAITGRLGNSRMILKLDVGEEARRNLIIENINDVPLVIELVASGDLADNVKFEENSFTLQPGEEKKAYFTIKSTKSGTTETKINVMFKPPTGAGVGLSANIIVIAGGETTEDDSETEEENPGKGAGFSFTSSPAKDAPSSEKNLITFSPMTLLAISTAILAVIFIVLLVYSKKLNRKKRSRGPRE